MGRLVITITITTEVDPSTVLDLAQEAAEQLGSELGSYGETRDVDSAECVAVTSGEVPMD